MLYFSPMVLLRKTPKQGLDASVSKKSVYIAVMKDTKEDVSLLSDWPQSKRGKRRGHRRRLVPIGRDFGAFDRSFSILPGSSYTICQHSHWDPSDNMFDWAVVTQKGRKEK